jgi:hypothetical protein
MKVNHKEVRHNLYDFLRNALDDDERRLVQEHLDACGPCKHELQHLERTLQLLSPALSDPAAVRDDAFWNELAQDVEKQIGGTARFGVVRRMVENVRAFTMLRPTYAYAAAASLILLVALLFTRQPVQKERAMVDGVSSSEHALVQERPEERMSEYFRKSRTLLVGIANMRPEHIAARDLSEEQEFSRALVHEARALKQQGLDPRAARLVNDLEKIFIEFTNIEPSRHVRDVELVRSGIVQENLLFKLRMAEAVFDTTMLQFANDGY